jgi:hypothetical protein
MQGHSNITSAYTTQADKIEALLRSKYGEWVPAYDLADIALQYCARINSIRKKLDRSGDRERIENKTEWRNGQCHGSYRIILTSDVLGITPAKPQPLKSWEEIVKEREEKMRQAAPSFELVP